MGPGEGRKQGEESPVELTEHSSLFHNESSQIPEDFIQLVNTRLNLSDLNLPLSDLGLLELELVSWDWAKEGRKEGRGIV